MKVHWSRVELERDFIVALARLRAIPDPQALQRLWARLSPESQNPYRVQRAPHSGSLPTNERACQALRWSTDVITARERHVGREFGHPSHVVWLARGRGLQGPERKRPGERCRLVRPCAQRAGHWSDSARTCWPKEGLRPRYGSISVSRLASKPRFVAIDRINSSDHVSSWVLGSPTLRQSNPTNSGNSTTTTPSV